MPYRKFVAEQDFCAIISHDFGSVLFKLVLNPYPQRASKRA
jgi:hypothetical protein